MKRSLSVVVIFQEGDCRLSAARFCDRLVQKFWPGVEFELSWCVSTDLHDAVLARESAGKTASADLVIFALSGADEPELHVRAWIESWLTKRGGREGSLFDLTSGAMPGQAFFRRVAHRAGMDYLTEIPDDLYPLLDASAEANSARAGQVTGVLHSILKTRPPTRSPLDKF